MQPKAWALSWPMRRILRPMYTFHLNPERCSRVKQGQIAGPDEEQEP